MNQTVSAITSVESVLPFHVVGEEMRPLVRGAAFEVFDVRAPGETGPPPHFHPWDEAYVLLEGELTVQRGDETTTLLPGQCAHIPAMTLHFYKVLSSEAHFLTITSPAGAARFFEDVDQSVSSPDDLPGLVGAARRNNVDSPLFPS